MHLLSTLRMNYHLLTHHFLQTRSCSFYTLGVDIQMGILSPADVGHDQGTAEITTEILPLEKFH